MPELEQNSFAKWMIQDLETERNWEKTFAESEDILDVLADEALAENNKGKTKNLDIDKS